MIEKTDDALQTVNDSLKGLTDKITPNIVLLVALINGFIIGLVTTGYLGASSVSVRSGTFALIIWQFLIICVFSTRYIELTTNYLNKFILCGVTGYMWQWQFFGMIDPHDLVVQPFDNPGAIFFIGYLSLLALFGYCFRGNYKIQETKIYSLKDKHVA